MTGRLRALKEGWWLKAVHFLAFTILCRTDEIVFGFSGGKDSTVSELLLLDVISISSLCS
jgi:tRNA(Ile)-lysidine synthase TilS/MesJ